jgi:membrane associated rhomboid family serine protease
MTAPPTPVPVRTSGRTPLVALYLVLALAGLVGTWYFNLTFTPGPDGAGYVQSWFANPASSSAAVDVIVTALAACVFFVTEGRRIGLRRAWVLVPLTFLVALAATFPLFLALRERRLAAADPVPGTR